jgi:hypothetical protein
MLLMRDPFSPRNYLHAQAVSFVLDQFPQRFLPISPDAILLGDLQPGYAALLLLTAGVVIALFKPDWELRILSLAGVLLVCMLAPVPGVNAFLYSAVPDPVYGFCSVGLWLRFLPLLAVVSIFSGGLAVVAMTTGKASRLWHGAALVGLLGALIWNLTEIQKPIERGHRATNLTAATSAFYRPETAAIYYAYDRLPRPRYLTNGISDYHLESRLLSVGDYALIPDPLLGAPGGKVTTFASRPNQFNPALFNLEPKFEIPAGEHLLLRFEFFDRNYEGYLSMAGPEYFQRTYYLPESGFFEKSFGVAPSRPKVLSVWNTRSTSQEVAMAFMANSVPEAGKPFGDFARIRLQRFKPDDLQIKMRSLIPYRADVALETPAYLETPRIFIPGYSARVNGRAVKVEASPDYLAMVRLEPGNNEVEIRYRGTTVARLFLVFSAGVWLAELGYATWCLRRWLSTKSATA